MKNVSVQVYNGNIDDEIIVTVAKGDGRKWRPKYFIKVFEKGGELFVTIDKHKGSRYD